MKRNTWKISYFCFLIIYLVVLLVIGSTDIITEDMEMLFASIYILLMVVTILAFGGIQVIKFFIEALRSMRSCGDVLFDELDEYKQHCGESKEHYQDVIQAISCYYSAKGKVETIVGNDLLRLFNRAEFLRREIRTGEHLITCITSVGLSVAASLLFAMEFKNESVELLNMIIGFLVFFAMLLVPYNKIIKGDSNEIYNYELKLLEEKIVKAEEMLCHSNINEEIISTKKNVLNVLGDKYVTVLGRKNKVLLDDIRCIEKLDLHVDNVDEYKKMSFTIGKTKRAGILLFNKEDQLVNEQYKKLYSVLRKYDLIYKIEGEDTK